MFSSNNNLKNPFSVNEIDLVREKPSWKNPTICPCTQDFYDRIETKDPNTEYIIIDSKNKKVYIGDQLCIENLLMPFYSIGIDIDNPNVFIIYFHSPVDWTYSSCEVCRFNNVHQAVTYIKTATLAGSHQSIEIYNLIKNYILGNMSCNDLILGLFAFFGFDKSSNFHSMVTTINTYGEMNKERDIPICLREDLRDWRDNDNNHFFKFYSSIYDIIVKYNFFLSYDIDKSDEWNLSTPIKEIYSVFKSPDGMYTMCIK